MTPSSKEVGLCSLRTYLSMRWSGTKLKCERLKRTVIIIIGIDIHFSKWDEMNWNGWPSSASLAYCTKKTSGNSVIGDIRVSTWTYPGYASAATARRRALWNFYFFVYIIYMSNVQCLIERLETHPLVSICVFGNSLLSATISGVCVMLFDWVILTSIPDRMVNAERQLYVRSALLM